jgi:hypothetical protein
VLAVIYENVEGCASTVRTPKATGKRATATGWFGDKLQTGGRGVTPDHTALAVAIINFGAAAMKAVSKFFSSRNPREKTLGF